MRLKNRVRMKFHSAQRRTRNPCDTVRQTRSTQLTHCRGRTNWLNQLTSGTAVLSRACEPGALLKLAFLQMRADHTEEERDMEDKLDEQNQVNHIVIQFALRASVPTSGGVDSTRVCN